MVGIPGIPQKGAGTLSSYLLQKEGMVRQIEYLIVETHLIILRATMWVETLWPGIPSSPVWETFPVGVVRWGFQVESVCMLNTCNMNSGKARVNKRLCYIFCDIVTVENRVALCQDAWVKVNPTWWTPLPSQSLLWTTSESKLAYSGTDCRNKVLLHGSMTL